MSAIKLELIHAFGSTCSKGYRNCIAISDEQRNEPRVVFPVGKALARKTIDRPQMQFIPFDQNTEHIENIVILPTRSHVAVAYSTLTSLAQLVRIYGFKGEDPITLKIFHQSQKSGQVKLMYFSPSQPKFMCAVLGQPHNKLLFVDSFKNKALAESPLALKDADRLTISPANSHLICLSGGSSIRLFRVQQYTFKPLQEVRRIPKGRRITTHAWYKKKYLLAATDKCQILLLEQVRQNAFEVRQQYHNVFNELKTEGLSVTAVCTFSKGFVLGSNTGKFCLWTRKQDSISEQQQSLQLSRKWATTQQRAAEVTNIEISSKQDLIAISLANNDIATLYINELIPQVSDLLNDLTDKQIIFEYLYKGFHNQPITGMDICEQRPLIATCSHMDSTIRIWNYKNYGCKLLRMFYFKMKEDLDTDKPLLTLAFHPSGYYLAVGCVDKLRLFHVLNNELRPYRELGVRNAHIVKFSKGGHLLATAFPLREQANINHIKIFNALTLEEIIVFKDHLSTICHLQFKKYDQSLLSVSQQGMIIEWRISDWSKTKNIVKRQMNYNCCIYSHMRNSMIAFGEFRGKNYLEQHGQNGSMSQFQMENVIVDMKELTIGQEKSILLSLSNGRLVVFGGLQRPIVMDNKNLHIGKAGLSILSPCGKYLMTAGEDGVVLVFKVILEVEGIGREEEIGNIVVDDFLADVVLISRREIERVSEKQKQFSRVLGSLGKKLKLFSEQGLAKHGKRMLQAQLQKNRIIDDLVYRIERLRSQVSQLKSKNSVQLQHLDNSHFDRAQTLQRTYEEKISFEVEKFFQLQQELIQIKLVHKREMQDLRKMEEEEIKKLKEQFQNKFKQSQSVYSSAKKEGEKATGVFQGRLKQIEQQQQQEMREIQSKKHKFKQQTAAILQDLFQKQAKLKKQHTKLTDQRSQQRRKNEQKLHGKKKLEKEVEEAREKLKDMNSQLSEKLSILRSKQQRLIQFEAKVSELQKKKHILSYKGTEMKKAMQPKELQIQKLKGDLIKLKRQFETSLQRKQKSILGLERSQKQKISLQKLLQNQRAQTSKAIQTIDLILGDMFHCLQSSRKSNDIKIFYKQFVKLYHRYVNKEERVEALPQSKGLDELTKQVVHLEKSLFQINRGNQKNIVRKNDEIFKRIKENTELVTNLNEIKKDNKEISLQIRSKKEEIEKLRANKAALLSEARGIDTVTYKMFLQEDYQNDKAEKPRPSILQSSSKLLLRDTADKRNTHKIECQLISEIQFMSERLHKVDFYIRQMKQRMRRHLLSYRCDSTFTLEDEQPNEPF